MSAVGGILLAAGRGTRFGAEPKLLALLEGEPLVRHAALAALAAGLDPLIAVVGHRAQAVVEALSGLPVRPVVNPAYADGLSTSLRAGLSALGPEIDAAVILLADMPRVRPDLITALVARFERHRPAAVVPTFEGRRGNPVLLGRGQFGAIATLGGDAGAGAFLRRRRDVAELAWEEPSILQDVDTAQALSALSVPGASVA